MLEDIKVILLRLSSEEEVVDVHWFLHYTAYGLLATIRHM